MQLRGRTGGRRVAVSAILFLALAAPAAVADPGGEWPGGPGGFGPARLRVEGAGASQEADSDYGLGIWARTPGAPEEADGQFRYGHHSPDGEVGVAGRVRCLSQDDNGLVQASGFIFGSGGENDAGQDFAVTIDTRSDPQRFSDLRLADPDTLAPCSGGGPGFHPVTRGGYRTQGTGK